MSLKGPFRDQVDGHQIVRVRFPHSYRSYAYRVAPEVGTLAVGDTVWTPGNGYKPEGGPARVIALGSEYSGEFAVITQKLDPGYVIEEDA